MGLQQLYLEIDVSTNPKGDQLTSGNNAHSSSNLAGSSNSETNNKYSTPDSKSYAIFTKDLDPGQEILPYLVHIKEMCNYATKANSGGQKIHQTSQ